MVRPVSLLILSVEEGSASGAETVLLHLIRAVSREWLQRLMVCAPRGSRLLEEAGQIGVATIAWPARRNSILSNCLAAARLPLNVRTNGKIGAVHAWGARAFDAAFLLARRFRVAALATLHDHPRASFHSPPRQAITRFVARRTHAVVCVSAALQRVCQKDHFSGRLTLVRNGISDRPAVPDRALSDTVRFGFLGMGCFWKGFPTIASWVASTMDDARIRWHLFGEPEPGALRILARMEARARDRCTLHGRRQPESIFDHIDAVAHPSTEFDPFPTVLIEAARAGLPTVASDIGGSSEIISHGESGFLFKPDQAQAGLGFIRTLAQNAVRRRLMGRSARRRFEMEFQASRMAASYEALWDETLSRDHELVGPP